MTITLPQDLLFQEVSIHFEERNGWVRIFTDAEFRAHPQLPLFLSGTLTQWFRERPQLCLRCVVPIGKGGDTVELHAWYDLNLFPAPSSGQATAPSRT
jgi:hypothetical protein